MLERIRTLISENIVLIISRPTAFLIGIATIVLSAISNFGWGGREGGSQPKEERAWKKWLSRLADTLKWLAGESVEALPAIVGSVVGAILRFFKQGCLIYC